MESWKAVHSFFFSLSISKWETTKQNAPLTELPFPVWVATQLPWQKVGRREGMANKTRGDGLAECVHNSTKRTVQPFFRQGQSIQSKCLQSSKVP